MGHFSPLNKLKDNTGSGQNLVLQLTGPGQTLVQNNPRPGQDRGYMRHFSPRKDIKNPTPGQNLVIKIDWTRANFRTK